MGAEPYICLIVSTPHDSHRQPPLLGAPVYRQKGLDVWSWSPWLLIRPQRQSKFNSPYETRSEISVWSPFTELWVWWVFNHVRFHVLSAGWDGEIPSVFAFWFFHRQFLKQHQSIGTIFISMRENQYQIDCGVGSMHAAQLHADMWLIFRQRKSASKSVVNRLFFSWIECRQPPYANTVTVYHDS